MSKEENKIQLKEIYDVPERNRSNPTPHFGSHEAYEKEWKESIQNPDKYWAKVARENLDWIIPFKTTVQGSWEHGNFAWFPEGYLNVSYNCVDRHAAVDPDRVAIIYEADEPGKSKKYTYGDLLAEVCRVANVLKSFGVKKGDSVAIYLPMIVEAVVTFLACARIGAVHSVIFAGFSAESLRDRIVDAKSKVVVTTDEGRRGGKTIATKNIVDAALRECPSVERCLVFKRTGNEIPMTKGRDLWWHDELAKHKPFCAPELMNAEDPLFLLYTSGSTGKPKGVMHTTGGYLLGAHLTVKYTFDVHPGDRFACMADIGWITGHTYIVYGPLSNGVTTLVFESTPVYPDASRYWQCVAEHKITQFYTAPTAIRLLRRMGDDFVKDHDLSSIRVLGSVGEPINPEAWGWYSQVVGKGKCAVVDTMWQTETGSHIITPLPGAHKTKPGSASFPFFGIETAILEPTTGKELEGNDVEGVLAIKKPWPSMARTVAGDHARFLDTYLRPYPGYYFTGDGAARDKDGYIWIKGRVDDVINVSGHRLSTAEIESALVAYKGVAEVAVIAAPDELTGQTVHAFVAMKPDAKTNDETALKKELTLQVRRVIGPFAAPRTINLLAGDDLPKTRSGKIMRRILRKISSGESDTIGDTSTLADPSVVDRLIELVEKNSKK